MIYALVKSFLHPTTKQKIIFESGNTCDALTDRVHPKQLEQKYGGEADDLTEFWPPRIDSNEYGVDESKLVKKPKSKKFKQSKKNTLDNNKKEVSVDSIQIKINSEVAVLNPEEEGSPDFKEVGKVNIKNGGTCKCIIF